MLSLTHYRVPLWTDQTQICHLHLHLLFCRNTNLENDETVWGSFSQNVTSSFWDTSADRWMEEMNSCTELPHYSRTAQLSLKLQHSSPTHLLLSGHLSCDQQPEEALRQRLLTSWSFGQQLLTLWNAVAPETDALCINGERERERKIHIQIILKYTINWVLASFQHELWLYQLIWMNPYPDLSTWIWY